MPIKPMDMQVLLPNVQKAAKPANVKNAKNELAQQQHHVQEKVVTETKKNKVSQLDKKDRNDIKDDKNKESLKKDKDKKKKKKGEKDDDQPVAVDVNHGSKFDIKV